MFRTPFVCAVLLLMLAACGRHPRSGQRFHFGFGKADDRPGAAIRLPQGVTPVRYDIAVAPDAERMAFSGHVDIQVDVAEPTREVILNALELTFGKVTADNGVPAKTSVDTSSQRATLTFDNDLAQGRHVLHIDYKGVINPYSAGLFALDYDTPQGKQKQLITQFESADARRFVPSWDEPDRKAVFQLTVTAPADRLAVSNMPVAQAQDLAGGLRRTTFQPTPKMSSYLLFLGVGDMERISQNIDGVDIGVVFRRGAQEKARFALQAAGDILRYYNDYFGVKYPLPKLDLVAAPGAGSFGAMENWGAILYFENDLLVDPQLSTEHDRQTVWLVIAHEMAHQWFGDLVTMDWWDDLWLNESFANWMEAKAIDHLHPDWEAFLIEAAGKQSAYALDATSSSHPVVQPAETLDQVNEAGDAITYDKGAAVIRMLEAYVGADAWQKGVRAYIAAHAYGNAVRGDLWKAIETAAGKPVAAIAHDFTEQAGVPLIGVDKVAGAGAGSAVTLRQGRFGLDAASTEARTWQVPVGLASLTARDPVQTLVAGPDPRLVTVKGPAPIVANWGQVGYFRSLYAEPLFQVLAERLDQLPAADQLGLVADAWPLGEGGYAPVSRVLDLARRLPVGADPLVWNQTAQVLGEIDGLYDGLGARQDAFRAFARSVLSPVLARIGWAERPGEPATAAVLRETLIETLGRLDDPAVAAEAMRRFAAFQADPSSLGAGIRRPVLDVVGGHADAATLQALRALAARSTDPSEKRQYLEAMAAAGDPAIAQQVMLLLISPETPASLAPRLMLRVAERHPEAAWRFALDHKAVFDARSDAALKMTLLPGMLRQATDARLADELHAFAQKAYPEGGRRGADKVEARVRLRAKVRDERLAELDRWLATAGPAAQTKTAASAAAVTSGKVGKRGRRG